MVYIKNVANWDVGFSYPKNCYKHTHSGFNLVILNEKRFK